MTIGSVCLLRNSAAGSWAIYRNYRKAMFGIVCDYGARQFAAISEADFHLESIGDSEIYLMEECFIVPELRSLIVGLQGFRTNFLHFCEVSAFFRVMNSPNSTIDVSTATGSVIKPRQIDYSFAEWSLRQKVGETSREVFRAKKGELLFEPFDPNP